MDNGTLLVALGNLVFVVVCGTVGIRLLAMAARTRQAPELCVGVALVALVLTIPAMAFGGIGRTTVGELHWPLVAGGLFTLLVGTGFLFAFTWKTFRPHEGWARLLVVAGTVTQAVVLFGAFRALWSTSPDVFSAEAAPGWMLAMRGPLAVSFGWTTVEGFLAWVMARRRIALGLGDAVAANRMILWAWVGLLSTLNNVVSTWLQMHGASSTNDPVAAGVMAVGGLIPAILMWLVFMPPRAYLERVAASAAPGA